MTLMAHRCCCYQTSSTALNALGIRSHLLPFNPLRQVVVSPLHNTEATVPRGSAACLGHTARRDLNWGLCDSEIFALVALVTVNPLCC